MNQLILDAYRKRDKTKLSEFSTQLKSAIDEMDIFFDEYLDVFSDKMSGIEDPSDPVWKAYKDKFKEHQEAQSNFKLANYYLGML
jgi:hypothetical protein